jgi:hypothetical protein
MTRRLAHGTALDVERREETEATMKTISISAAFVFIQLTTLGGCAQARAATASGVSLGVGLDEFVDGTVTDSSGQSVHGQRGQFDLGALGNLGDFAFGGGVAGSPDILGDGRLLLGARAGWQPTFGRTRVQLLGETGIHRYTHVEEGLFSMSTPDLVSTPYVGAQLGFTRELVKNGLFEYGVALFVRQDMNRQTIVHQEEPFLGGPTPPPTELTVGGTMLGVAVTLGFRVDSASIAAMKHRQAEGSVRESGR